MKRAFFIGIIFTLFYIPSTICTESKPTLTYEEVLNLLHFEDHDRQALEEGKVQARELEPRSDKELAISVAVMIDKPLPAIYESLHAGRLMKHTSKLQGFQRIHIDPLKPSAFADVRFKDEEEIQNLFHAQPGTMFNLSQKEIKQIRDRFGEITHENKSQISQSLSQIYQKFLFERCRNYQQNGIKQIPPYAREEGKTNPGKELKLAVKESKWLNTYYPKFCQAFREYPHRQNKRYEHRFYWIEQTVDERPAYILTHRMFHHGKNAAIYAEREFYVGHSYNSLQVVGGGLPVEGKTLLFGIYRVFTDRITGFLNEMKQELGEGMEKERIENFFQRLKKYLVGQEKE